MKLLLTSTGITNKSIERALLGLLGKPIAESKVVCIPTALYGVPDGINYIWHVVRDVGGMGWKEFAILELTALPSIPEEIWLPTVEASDVIFVGPGNNGYLSYWMHESGFASKLPELLEDRVYCGSSAGSMMLTPGFNVDRERLEKTGIYHDDEYDETAPPNAGSDRGLNLVNFLIRPHLNADYFHPLATMELMEKAAAKVDVPLYAIDDQTAIKVVDGAVEVVSEGEWRLFDE